MSVCSFLKIQLKKKHNNKQNKTIKKKTKKTNKKQNKTDELKYQCTSMIHSNFEVYISHTFIYTHTQVCVKLCICNSLNVNADTQKKEPMKRTYKPQRKEKVKKKRQKKKRKKERKGKKCEDIGLHATEV